MLKRTVFLLMLIAAAPAFAQFDEFEGDVPYVPTPQDVVEEMLKLGGAKAGDVVYDLGCGDGRIVITAVKKFSAVRGVGIDLNPQRVKEATGNAEKEGVAERVKFRQEDLFKADFHEATLVTLYLLPSVNERLKPRLLAQLKPGTRIVSHQFDMGDWKADKKVELSGRTLYLWTVPAK